MARGRANCKRRNPARSPFPEARYRLAKSTYLCHHMRMRDVRNPLESGKEQQNSTAVRALARVASHYGLTLDPQQLIRTHPFKTEEPTASLLLKMAEGTGLRAKLMRIKRGELGRLARFLPAILLLPNGKAAVINRVQAGEGASCALIDELESESGLSALYDEPRLFEFWEGDVILLKLRWRAAGAERPFGFGWLLDQLLIERKLFRDIAIAAVLMSILALFTPITVMIMIDRVLYNHSMSTLHVLGAALVVIIGFETLFGYLRRCLIWLTTTRIDAKLNLYVFDKLLNLPMSLFERLPTGLISAKISQIWHIRQFMSQELFGTVLDSVTLFILLPVLFILSWKLACFVLVLAFCILGVYLAFLPALRQATGRVITAEQQMWS